MISTSFVEISTQGGNEMHDLTTVAQDAITDSGCQAGIATVFVAHTTASIAISEYEPGLISDIHGTLERIAPAGYRSLHNQLNRDDNSHSHLRSTVIGPSMVVPFDHGRLLLGTWQRIVLIDFDTHPRTRTVHIQVMGE